MAVMTIKTILIHMAHDEQHGARLDAALDLARRFDARLDVLYIATPISMPAAVTGRGASYAYLSEATVIAHEKAGEIEHEIRQRCADVPYSWAVVEGDHLDLLAERSHYADIAVVSQSHTSHLEDHVRLHLPDRLPLQAACPTLVIPWDGAVSPVCNHILVAWKACREASRAVRDAMPLLKTAEKVTVLLIQPPNHPPNVGQDIEAFLKSHGVTPTLHTDIEDAGSGDVGEIILTVARDRGCDSIVMGAYGHSRWREMVVGGATRHVLGHMTVPVIMSH